MHNYNFVPVLLVLSVELGACRAKARHVRGIRMFIMASYNCSFSERTNAWYAILISWASLYEPSLSSGIAVEHSWLDG